MNHITGLAAALILAIGAAAAAPASAAEPFNITSPAFRDGGKMPLKYGAVALPNGKKCAGQNISPPLRWSHVPKGTKSFAITMYDPAGAGGIGVLHWLAYDIPASVHGFAEGETSKPAKTFVGGKNQPGTTLYFGSCPPPGDKPHPYVITLIALDLAPGTLPAGLAHDAFIQAIRGHNLGATTLVGRYGR